MSELKACPFCGKSGRIHEFDDAYEVYCTGPGCTAQHRDLDKNSAVAAWNSAVAAWNRRSDDEGRLREELDEAKKNLDYMARGVYRGNTISYIYDKAKCYGDQVMMAFNALRLIGFEKGDANGNRELEAALMKWAEKTKARLASLPADPSAELCDAHDSRKNCTDECAPAPAKGGEKL